jgi:hypothetical protein
MSPELCAQAKPSVRENRVVRSPRLAIRIAEIRRRPSENTKPARELAFIFAHGQRGVALALSGK